MLHTSLFSILFVSVCIVSLACGILVLQKSPGAGQTVFFARDRSDQFLVGGLALATIALTPATCEIWRRFSAIGWEYAYAILLHFILIITGSKSRFRNGGFIYAFICRLITVFAFVPMVLTLYLSTSYQRVGQCCRKQYLGLVLLRLLYRIYGDRVITFVAVG